MTKNQSIIRKIESEIDDFLDLWRHRRGICIIVLIILVVPICFSLYFEFLKIPDLESNISGLEKGLDITTKERDKAEIQLAPFLAAAERSFPKAPLDQRLKFLMDKLDDVATLEKQKEMIAILERMQCIIRSDHDVLIKKYPKGYFLFASDKYVVIPSRQKTKFDLSLDWVNSEIKSIDDSFVLIILRSLRYYPTEILVENLNIILERKIGATADGIFFNKNGLYVELLDDKVDEMVYVIGFREVEIIPQHRELKTGIEDYKKKHNLGSIVSAINTAEKKILRLLNLTITSGWKDV